MPILLYSTNPFLKYRIQQEYRGQHFAWCSPVFDARVLNRYALGADQPPSSDPYSIYANLHKAVNKNDEHDTKINEQKKTLPAIAVQWCNDGHISDATRDEIIAIVAKATFREWRPLIYVIPFSGVSGRVIEVERARRASSEPEYIIEDLRSSEFDIIEPAP